MPKCCVILYLTFSGSDLINLPNYHIYLKLMIDGVVSQPFSGETSKSMELRSVMRPS
jgi:hypothetical protein